MFPVSVSGTRREEVRIVMGSPKWPQITIWKFGKWEKMRIYRCALWILRRSRPKTSPSVDGGHDVGTGRWGINRINTIESIESIDNEIGYLLRCPASSPATNWNASASILGSSRTCWTPFWWSSSPRLWTSPDFYRGMSSFPKRWSHRHRCPFRPRRIEHAGQPSGGRKESRESALARNAHSNRPFERIFEWWTAIVVTTK